MATQKEPPFLPCTDWVRERFTPCPANDRVGEACWRDTPMKAGQARMQASIHARWWGYSWLQGPRSSLVGLRSDSWRTNLSETGRNAGRPDFSGAGGTTSVQVCHEFGQLLTPRITIMRWRGSVAHRPSLTGSLLKQSHHLSNVGSMYGCFFGQIAMIGFVIW